MYMPESISRNPSRSDTKSLSTVLEKWKLQHELKQAISVNQFSAELAKNLNPLEKDTLAIMRAIDPLLKQERQLQHDIEYLNMEKELLGEFFSVESKMSSNFTPEELEILYMEKLNNLQEIFFSSYLEFLKSRDYIFLNDGLIPLDTELRRKLVDDLKPVISNSLLRYKEEFLKISRTSMLALFERKLQIEKLLNEKMEELFKLIDKKTPYGVEYNDIGEKMSIIKMEKLKKYQSAEQDLPTLCFCDDINEVHKILKKNPKLVNQPNACGELPLHRACEAGNLAMVTLLTAEFKANPEKIDETNKELSAYHYACMQGDERIREYLYQKKKDGYKCLGKHQRTVLHSAAYVNNRNAVLWLISKKLIDINAKDKFTGATALHLAAWHDYAPLVRLLLQNGANPRLDNLMGDTAIYTAVLYRRASALCEFLRAGYCLNETDFQRLLKYLPKSDPRFLANMKVWQACIEAAYTTYLSECLMLPEVAKQSVLLRGISIFDMEKINGNNSQPISKGDDSEKLNKSAPLGNNP